MKTRYSKTTGCFYPFDVEYHELPEDIIEVSMAEYDTVMNRQQGDSFEFVEGAFVIRPPEDIPFEVRRNYEFASARKSRELILNRISNIATFSESEMEMACLKIARKLLLDFTDNTAIKSAVTEEDLKSAITDYFRAACEFDLNLLNGTFAEVVL